MQLSKLLELEVEKVVEVPETWVPWVDSLVDQGERAARGRLLRRAIEEEFLREGSQKLMGGAYWERDFLSRLLTILFSPDDASKRLSFIADLVGTRCSYVKAARKGGISAAATFWKKATTRDREDPLLRKVLEKAEKKRANFTKSGRQFTKHGRDSPSKGKSSKKWIDPEKWKAMSEAERKKAKEGK